MDGVENELAQGQAAENQNAYEPVDLAQAFKILGEEQRAAAQEPVAEAGASGEVEPPAEPAGVEGPGDSAGSAETGVQAPSGDTGRVGGGGSSAGIDAIDFNARKQGILREIQQSAKDSVYQEFKKEGVDYFSINELTVRDEDTGRIRFRNPDVGKDDTRNPDYYFASRSDAMAFVDAWNKGVDAEFRKAVNKKQQDLLQQRAPQIRLIDFAPTWMAMSDQEKAVFDQLVAPYAVRDGNGGEIGYNCDLGAVAKQAKAIVAQFAPPAQQAQPQPQQQAKEQKQSEGPAMDMKTGNGKAQDESEPKTLAEAMKMINERKKNG